MYTIWVVVKLNAVKVEDLAEWQINVLSLSKIISNVIYGICKVLKWMRTEMLY